MRSAPGALTVERRVFLGAGAFLVPWTVVYAVTSEDRAGALLLGACALALAALGGFLLLVGRRVSARPEDVGEGPHRPHLDHRPHAVSLWPFVIGSGATLLGYGLAFTVWVAIPAGLLIGIGVLGYARESSVVRSG